MQGPESFYQFLLKIPKGKVSTYQLLSKRFEVHPRTIASWLKSNPFPERYPCYKVVHHSGEMGGYVLGKDIKRCKLTADGVKIFNDFVSQDSFFVDTIA